MNGKTITLSFPMPQLAALDIPQPTTLANIEVSPVDVVFPRGKTYTKWVTLNEAKVRTKIWKTFTVDTVT